MAVTLHIVEPSFEYSTIEPFTVPDGSIITVRRHAQGADIAVVPQVGATVPEKQWEVDPTEAEEQCDGDPMERWHKVVVHSLTVKRTRPGSHEVAIVGDDGLYRLFFGGCLGSDLGAALSNGAPSSGCDAREAALTRHAKAQADLAELEVAEMTRAARVNDRDVQADRLSVHTDEDDGTITLCVADITGGPELKTRLRQNQLLWLAQQLLAAYGRCERKGR